YTTRARSVQRFWFGAKQFRELRGAYSDLGHRCRLPERALRQRTQRHHARVRIAGRPYDAALRVSVEAKPTRVGACDAIGEQLAEQRIRSVRNVLRRARAVDDALNLHAMAHQASALAMEKFKAMLAAFGADDLAGKDAQPSSRLQLGDARCDLRRAAMAVHIPPRPQMAQK